MNLPGVKQLEVPAKHCDAGKHMSCASEARYVIVTPVRNEDAYLEKHLASVVRKTYDLQNVS